MYFLKIANLGFIHKSWKDEEPHFCREFKKAKSWKSLEGALNFGDTKLTPQLAMPWEVWQEVEGDLVPLVRPRSRG
jgi:hypothetical protein